MNSELANDEPTHADDAAPSKYRPLRIWPPLLLIGGMLLARAIPNLVENGPPNLWMSAAFGPAICSILMLLWWVTFSRAAAIERLIGVIGILVAVVITIALIDKSMIGPGTMVVTVPMGMAAFGIGTTLLYRVLSLKRTLLALLLATIGFGFSTLLRNEGLWGDFSLGLRWRFAPSDEQNMLAERALQPSSQIEIDADQFDRWLADPQWPGFRGADRQGTYLGPAVSPDWPSGGLEQLWKISVGPGWSSFSIAGSLLFTQEQRGEMETVVCYHADDGREVWTRAIESRFEDTLGGPGPRATPTVAGDALYVMGASGQLMRLDPKTGEVVWDQDLRKIADRDPPMWGFCSSPLVVDTVVIVHAGGKGDKGTLAFDTTTGDLRWSAAAGDHTYSSPQLDTIGNEKFVVMLTNEGLDLLDPTSGESRLDYQWKHEGYRSLQPRVVDGSSILLPTGMGAGTRRIDVTVEDNVCVGTERWTSLDLKPDFNDLVVHEGYVYGFNSAVFTCIDLETGAPMWKGGRYGKGQVLLLKESGLLLVVAERGDVVLLAADPAGHKELAKFKALDGKTWNHPVVNGDRLFVRNSKEAACFRLPLAESTP